MSLFQPIKQIVLRGARMAGIQDRVLASDWRRRRLAILCYHGVSIADEHLWDPRYYVSPAFLQRRFEILREMDCAVLGLDEAVCRLQDQSLPARSVVLTFDDGCHDFYKLALPLLEACRFPAAVYLTTYYCRRPQPVFGMFCDYVLWKARHALPAGERLPGFDFLVDLTSEIGRRRATERVVASSVQRGLPLEEKEALVERLARALHVDTQPIHAQRMIQLMRPEEVACAASRGIDIQLHTHRHRTPSQRELFVREIDDNRRAIAEMTGSSRPLRHFCYPSGVYHQRFLPWLEQQDVVSATTCDAGLASSRDSLLLLPRIVDHSRLSEAEFQAWVSGARYLLSAGRPKPAVGANP